MLRSIRPFLTAVAVSGLVSACAGIPPRTGPAPALLPVDTLFYISARAREDGRDVVRLADSLEYGLVITMRPAPTDPLEGRVDFVVVDSVRLSRTAFVHALRARMGTPADTSAFAVFYTHGFGTSLREAWQHSATSRTRSRGDQPWVVFAWPSFGSGVTLPRGGDPFLAAYRQDSASAVASRGAYAQALTAVHDAIGGARILAVAHSLGGQLLGETLARDSALRVVLEQDPLRGIAFVSPDVAAGHFGDVIVPGIRPLTQRLVLYASSDDRMLFISKRVNDSERAGRIANGDAGPTMRAGLETVDMTDGAIADSWLVHAFGTRHALRRKSAALFDIVHVVGGRESAECRDTLRTAQRQPTGAWKLTKRRLPPVAAVAQCDGAGAVTPER